MLVIYLKQYIPRAFVISWMTDVAKCKYSVAVFAKTESSGKRNGVNIMDYICTPSKV